MKWKRICKEKSTPSKVSVYSEWKPELAEEAFGYCVYCAVFDSQFGGQRNFHVEHHKPKSLFPELELEYANLYYACPVCNIFKSNDWHDSEDLELAHYPNPSEHNYCDFFILDEETGIITGNYKSATFLIEKLHLNRPYLITDRRFDVLHVKFRSFIDEAEDLCLRLKKLPDSIALKYFVRLQEINAKIHELHYLLRNLPLYGSEDLR